MWAVKFQPFLQEMSNDQTMMLPDWAQYGTKQSLSGWTVCEECEGWGLPGALRWKDYNDGDGCYCNGDDGDDEDDDDNNDDGDDDYGWWW